MKKHISYLISCRLRFIFAALMMLLSTNLLFADGSKDLYPSTKAGVRGFLYSSTTATPYFPYPNMAVHYVYAKEGERITMASSAQGSGNAAIRLTTPNATVSTYTGTTGVIANRTQELAGPQIPGQTIANRYTPVVFTVPSGGEGIYKVEFYGRNTTTNAPTTLSYMLATADWTQGNDNSIIAWDISVLSTADTFVTGRVYASHLNIIHGIQNPPSTGYYGIFYILTEDGTIYQINNNGSFGYSFTFFANNNGIINATTGAPTYESLNTSTSIGGQIHNPGTADAVVGTRKQVTHKIFYTTPASDLPESSSGAVPGGSTWLRNPIDYTTISNLTFTGAEGGVINSFPRHEGGYIKFTSVPNSEYTITLTLPSPYVTRTFTGITNELGAAELYWDGKDGAGTLLPGGSHSVSVNVQLRASEVHFPFIDMEVNVNGIRIERITPSTGTAASRRTVYWNDSDIPDATNGTSRSPKTNTTGSDSGATGNGWGTSATSDVGTYGNEKVIDTWAYWDLSSTATRLTYIREADLETVSVVPSATTVLQGEQMSYTVTVRNNGPSTSGSYAPFSFVLPQGLSYVSGSFEDDGCAFSTAITYDSTTNTISSSAYLPVGCIATYTLTAQVASTATTGTKTATASIMRYTGYSDPDASVTDLTASPTNATTECNGTGYGGGTGCNNIKSVTITVACTAPVISSITPATQTVTQAAAPTDITVTATGATTYQWYSNTTNSTTGGTLISGATSTT
ncbi:MAG: hypothetical protein QM564_12390, partial [Bergeyella sp.]